VIVQREIKFPRMHVCFRCGLPRIVCDRWSDDGRARAYDEDGKERVCQFYGVLVGVVYGIKHADPEAWDQWFSAAKKDPGWAGSMVKYLARPMVEEEGYGCQIGRAFMWLTEGLE
jgi:hypothetical protein